MFWVSQHPSSGVLKTVTAASGTGHTTGAATPLQRGPIGILVCSGGIWLFTTRSIWGVILVEISILDITGNKLLINLCRHQKEFQPERLGI